MVAYLNLLKDTLTKIRSLYPKDQMGGLVQGLDKILFVLHDLSNELNCIPKSGGSSEFGCWCKRILLIRKRLVRLKQERSAILGFLNTLELYSGPVTLRSSIDAYRNLIVGRYSFEGWFEVILKFDFYSAPSVLSTRKLFNSPIKQTEAR